ncbi:MAG: hypothetical protein HXY25_09905 [Alphaproteobacteria bacterium]|nr:hypothetical protein [Alphaproteobacteria bacterium]
MGWGRRLGALALLCGIGGCATGEGLMKSHGDPEARFTRFAVCHGYGCFERVTVSLRSDEVDALAGLFAPSAPDAAAERAQIARAIAQMERFVGPKAGTEHDRAGAAPLGGADQQDCIDEAVNTTTYLRLFAGEGWLVHHTVELPAHRGLDIGQWPHNTALIREAGPDGGRYVVDSWFHANGELPEIVPLALWAEGWRPARGAPPGAGA